MVLGGGAARGFQSGRFRLLLNGDEQPIDGGKLAGLADPAANVAGIYAALRDDIRMKPPKRRASTTRSASRS